MDFLNKELIPEMVYDRCFCEKGSREFVNLESIVVEPGLLNTAASRTEGIAEYPSEVHRVLVVVSFSGEPSEFRLIVKFLGIKLADEFNSNAYLSFMNEECFYSSIKKIYGFERSPFCYVCSMGRYGLPAIVLEDLSAKNYVPSIVAEPFDDDHLKICAKILGTFHGKGLRLKKDQFTVFNELCAKLSDTIFDDESLRIYASKAHRITEPLKLLSNTRLASRIKAKLGEHPLEIAKRLASDTNDISTICHGDFSRRNVLFKYVEGKPIDGMAIDWRTVRYCSPGIDLGPFLLSNLPKDDACQARSKVQEILMFYTEAVQQEFPDIASERLRAEIVSKLPYSYIIASVCEDFTDERLAALLLLSEQLGAFD